MEKGRRFFFSGLISSIALTTGALRAFSSGPQRQVPSGPRGPYPHVPDASDPGRNPDENPSSPLPDPKAQLKENQKNLRRDVDRLVQLANDLKQESDKTEQTDVLSLPLVKKAEEIEKLARHIKSLARGS